MSPVRVHHEVRGPSDGPVVVLADSLGSTFAMWDPQMADLTRTFRVVRYDLRGHGGSPAPDGPYGIADLGGDLLGLLDDLEIERASVCGLSLGAMVAMWVAAKAPDRIDRLVLCATSARLGPPEMWAARAGTVLDKGVGAVADLVVGRWFTPAYAAEHPEVVDRMRAMIASCSAVGYAGCCRALERMDLTGDLASIAAPTLVIVGADDVATPVEHAERIVARDPRRTARRRRRCGPLGQRRATRLGHRLDPRPPRESRAPGGHGMNDDQRRETGTRIRREVLGDDHVDRANAEMTPFSEPFQDFITRTAWGDVWARPGLDRRMRSAITLAILTALRADGEIEMHVRAALRNGLSPDEIAEVLLHSAVYAGVPAAHSAMAVANRTISSSTDGRAHPTTEEEPA